MTWAHYLLQVNIYLIIFYAFYKLLLDKETYFMLNRIYLIAAGLLSLSIPFMKPEWFMGAAAPQKFRISVDQLNMMMANVTIAPDEDKGFNWAQLVTAVYIIGILFFVVRLLLRLIAVRRLMNSRQEGVAFSFFRRKVIDETLPGLDTVHKHEDIHIRQMHTMDVLFFEVLGILVWCNPIIYLYKITVKNIHEYLADEEAALFQGDKETYAMLLLSTAFGIDQNVLTNSFFNQSLLKKRIFMLHQQRSKKTAILKYGLFVPLFGGMLLLSSASISRNKEIKDVAEKMSAPISLEAIPAMLNTRLSSTKAPVRNNIQDNTWAPFYTYLSRSIRYPVKALNNKLQGNTVIKFTIHKGEVSGLGVVSALGYGCDAMVMRNILNYEDFKEIKDGDYSIKIAFRLADAGTPLLNVAAAAPKGYTPLRAVTVTGNEASRSVVTVFQTTANNANTSSSKGTSETFSTGEKVFDFVSVETQPGFPGGMDNFYAYLGKVVKYPVEAQKNNIQGKVFLSFIVETDGQLSHIKVERPLGFGTDEEALRVMQGSPKWTPAMKNGEAVRVKYNLPISFTLVDNTTKPVAIRINQMADGHRPLFVIDGVKSAEADFKSVDPSNIKSINILKDVSATAAYGDDGKDGVVEITTKKGKTNTTTPASPTTVNPKN